MVVAASVGWLPINPRSMSPAIARSNVLLFGFYGATPVARKMATPAGVLKPQVWRTETLKRVAVISTVIVAGVVARLDSLTVEFKLYTFY